MKKKILIIDDEKDILELLEDLLSLKGYDVITALNGVEGIEKAIRERPDLILLDIMMPGINGFKVLSSLKEQKEVAYKGIIMLSAMGDSDSLIKAQELGSDDYIIKPFEIKELLEIIEKYVW